MHELLCTCAHTRTVAAITVDVYRVTIVFFYLFSGCVLGDKGVRMKGYCHYCGL